MVNLKRLFKHIFLPPWAWRRAFPAATLDAIEAAVRASETAHLGEIRFAIENTLAPSWVWRGMTGRARAIEVFSSLRVWDTEHNNGVLVYVLLADHDIEIVADRGIAARVDPRVWTDITHAMEVAFRAGEFERGALKGIAEIGAVLADHFPPGSRRFPDGDNPDELADRPAILR